MMDFVEHSILILKDIVGTNSALIIYHFQKASMSLSLCFLLYLTTNSLVAVQSKGLKILGGYVKEWSEGSRHYYGEALKWGQYQADQNSRDILIEKMFCWSRLRNGRGYCNHRLIVSTIDDPNEEHYQIIGSYQKIYDGNVILEKKFENGITERKPLYQRVLVANGHSWCHVTNSYRYGNLYFFVNRTTQPSITDDISSIIVKADDERLRFEESFADYHDSTSARVKVNVFRVSSREYGGNTRVRLYLWRAPTTLVKTEPLRDQANLISRSYNVKRTLVLSNKGSGVTSSNFPILGTTQTVTTTSESRFLSTWDFSFSIEQSISFQIFAVNSETRMTASFSYHNEREMKQTKSVTTTVDMKWPSECPAGFRVTYEVAEVIEEQEIPIKLYFKRTGIVWTEIDMVRVTLRKLFLTKDDCCLSDWADESCGSESLSRCDRIHA